MLRYFCPKCNRERQFRAIEDYRRGSNRFCPNDGTMLRPMGWKPVAPVNNATSKLDAREVSEKPRPPSKTSKQIRLGSVQAGMTDLGITATVLSIRKDLISPWREHAVATITDGSATLPLNLWRSQVSQVNAGNTIRLRQAFTQVRRGSVEISTWEEPIEVVRKGKSPAR